MKFGIVLNYMNYKQTISCADNLVQSGIDKIIIVDNASGNDSVNKLNEYFVDNKKIHIVLNEKNSGYAKGNNVGLRFIEEIYGISDNNIIYIINPDSVVTKNIVDSIADFISKTPGAGAVTTLINNGVKSAWHHMKPGRAFLFNIWEIRWILGKMGIYEEVFYELNSDFSQPVDVVMGGFFGIGQSTFKMIDYFDEGTFLYYEEEALYARLKNYNIQNYLLNNLSFTHSGGGSTSLNKVSFKRINDNSKLYVLKKYYGVGSMYLNCSKLINKFDNKLLEILKR
ncbi:glycosyltransferase [Latilactobacillus sakei]|uniref:glycosyltransferase n=1 Tax=Latilactobacillus sakei TaxID=1599 RepID=UPI003F52F13B